MIITVLECAADGTQRLVQREVPDDFYPPDPEADAGQTAEGQPNG